MESRLTTPEVSQWDERQFIDFFRFIKLFMAEKEDKTGFRWSVKKETVKMANEFLETDTEPTFKALARKINETDSRKYYGALQRMLYVVGGFLKRNTAFVTPDIEKELEGNKFFGWIVEHYTAEMHTGQRVILPNIQQKALVQGGTIRGKETDLVLMEAQLKIVDMFWQIVKSIKMTELKEMSVKDRLYWMKEISPMVKQSRMIKPANVNVFNINKNDAEKLEKSLLDYAQGNERSET